MSKITPITLERYALWLEEQYDIDIYDDSDVADLGLPSDWQAITWYLLESNLPTIDFADECLIAVGTEGLAYCIFDSTVLKYRYVGSVEDFARLLEEQPDEAEQLRA